MSEKNNASIQIDAAPMAQSTGALLAWYDAHRRDLPWRGAGAYGVWLSEMLLQQTRVEAGRGYYLRFMQAYPNANALAAAPLDDVLKLWEGLGYYRRARSLHKAACVMRDRFGGQVPDTYEALMQLPGIGDYTAGAILSMAYNKPYPAMDGNALRVVARVCGVQQSIDAPAVRACVRALLCECMDKARPGDYNQAIMDIGAGVCVGNAPACDACPFAPHCRTRASGDFACIPKRAPKKSTPTLARWVLVLCNAKGEVWVRRRPEQGLLAGLWEFASGDLAAGETPQRAARAWLQAQGVADAKLFDYGDHKHVFTHVKWQMHIMGARIADGPALVQGQWVDASARARLTFPTAYKKACALAEEMQNI
nr:A/G-specific adenine glycosylase [Maliibacterium massiliense]